MEPLISEEERELKIKDQARQDAGEILAKGSLSLSPHDVRRLLELYQRSGDTITSKLDVTNFDRVLDGPIEIDEVIRGLEPGEYGVLSSPGGTGKSYLMLRAAIEMSLGLPILEGFFGPARPCGQKVVYLSLEDRPSTRVHNRVHAIFAEMQIRRGHPQFEQLKRNLTICDANTLAAGIPQGLPVDPENLPRLIIIDTFRSFAPHLAENDNDRAAELISGIMMHAQLYGAAVLIVHHVSKSALGAHGRGESTAGQSRGASCITDNGRASFTLWPPNPTEVKAHGFSEAEARSYVILRDDKANHSAGGSSQWFRKNSAGVPVPCGPPQRQGSAVNPPQATRGTVVDHERA